jgi:hypothetical protein
MKGQVSIPGWLMAVLAIIGVGAILVGTGTINNPLSGATGPADDQMVNPEIEGQSADVAVRAENVAGETPSDVSVNADLYSAEGEDISTATTNNDGTRVDLTGLTAGENYHVFFGVEDSGYYGDRQPNTGDNLINQLTVRETGEVYQAVGTSNLETTVYDEDGSSTTSVTVDSGETYSFDRMRVRVGAEARTHNFNYVYINDTELSGVDEWRISGATEIDVPEKLSDDYSHAFRVGEAGDLMSGEEPALSQFESAETGQIDLDMESGQDPSGDVVISVDDSAMYKDGSGDVQQGAEDESDSDVGVSAVDTTITVS